MDILVPTKKKNIVMDASLATALTGCERMADLRHNHRFVSINGKSNSLEVGSLVHKVLEYFYKAMVQGHSRVSAIDHALVAGKQFIAGCQYCTEFLPFQKNENGVYVMIDKPQCGHQVDEFPGLQNTPRENDKYDIGWQWAMETCEQYFDYYKNDSWRTKEVEMVKGEVLYEDDEIRILWKAKLDWIGETDIGILPMDHKTSKQRRDKLKLNHQFIGQCLLTGSRQVIINEIGFQTSLKPNEKFTRPRVSYTADNLLEWQSETLPTIAYKLLSCAETGFWPPNYNSCDTKYGKCTYIGICEADRHMREEELRLHFKVGPEWNPTND